MPRFSPTLLEHARYPSNQSVMERADLVGKASLNGNAPYITVFLATEGQSIKKASFEAHGCGVTTAVCSVTTELVEGKTIEECRSLTVEQICVALDGVPPDKLYCVHVGVQAFQNALIGQTGEGNNPNHE